MRFSLKKLENAGIEVYHDTKTGVLEISGTARMPEDLIEQFQGIDKIVAQIPGIGEMEACRLSEDFIESAIDTGTINRMKECQDK